MSTFGMVFAVPMQDSCHCAVAHYLLTKARFVPVPGMYKKGEAVESILRASECTVRPIPRSKGRSR